MKVGRQCKKAIQSGGKTRQKNVKAASMTHVYVCVSYSASKKVVSCRWS